MRSHPVPRAAPYRQVLANRPFVALWLGQAVSTVGDTLYNVALLWYVLLTTGSAFAAGGLTVLAGLGGLLGSLIAGAVLDRLPGRRVLLAADGVRLLCTAAICLPWLLGAAPSLTVLYALTVINALATACHNPARAAALPQVVPPNQLVTANALEGVSASLTSTAVFALTGVIVAVLGPARALALDAATFLVAFLAVWSVTWPEVGFAVEPGRRRALAALRAALDTIRADTLLRHWFAVLPFHAFAGGCFFAAIAPFLREQLAGGAALYGLQGAVYGVGLLVASAIVGAVAVRRIGALYVGGVILAGLGNTGFALAPSVPALLAAAFVAGLGIGALITGERSLLQTVVPAPFRGRVFALVGLCGVAVAPLGVALGGWLADHWRAQPILLVASLVHVALGLRLAALPRLRAARTSDGPG